MTTIERLIGNTRIIVHDSSGVIAMTSERQHEWFAAKLKARDPTVTALQEVCAVALDEIAESGESVQPEGA